jgi:uncharacterized membrane protein
VFTRAALAGLDAVDATEDVAHLLLAGRVGLPGPVVEPEPRQQHGSVFGEVEAAGRLVGARQRVQIEIRIVIGQGLDEVRKRAQGHRRSPVLPPGVVVATELIGFAPSPSSGRADRLDEQMALVGRRSLLIHDFGALVALVRWLADDLSEARLAVARDLAAERIKDLTRPPDPTIMEAARLAYTLHVERDVRESLDHQRVLEEAFRDLDDRVAEMRAKLAEGLDSALTKAIAGALTITIASLTSAKVRDWPATIAGIVLAAYLFLTAYSVWLLGCDSQQRLDESATLANKRQERLGDELGAAVKSWKTSLHRRACVAATVLSIAALAVLVGGIAQNTKITGGRDSAKPPPAATTGSSPGRDLR